MNKDEIEKAVDNTIEDFYPALLALTPDLEQN